MTADQRTIAFVTTELAPSVPGGAGSVVAELAERLVAAGHEVRIGLVADVDADEVAAPSGVTVDVEVPERDDADARSRAAGLVAGRIGPGSDLVEFVDFDALGYHTLLERRRHGLEGTRLAVRFHGPADLMVEAMEVTPPDLEVVRVMERGTFAMADAVIVPSEAVGALAVARYGLDPDRIVIGEPPIPPLSPHPAERSAEPEFIALGRLGEVKGSHDLVDAAVRVLDAGIPATFRFFGEDGWSATGNEPMTAFLARRIPGRHADRIRLEGRVPPERLGAALAGAWAVVIPSRFDSFSLGAHQARALGLPIVAPDLAAFADYWSEATGAVVYDGSVDGLAEALTALAGDERRLDRLAGAPLPAYRDPLAPYGGPLPPSRHPRAQSGLATAAGQRVLAVAPEAAPGLPRRLVSRGLRVVPRPAVDWVSRRLPGSLRRRLGGVSDWGGELERRRRLERTSAFELRLLDISDVDDPDVTVVIPVYNQGEFVMDAIMSVFEQTYESWEIVVVDDGSSDAVTVAMLDDLDLPRVRMVRQDNRGLSGARNTGMQLARGRYLVPLDADDEITPRFLERMVVLLEDHPGAAFAHCWAELFGDVHTLWVTRPFNPYVQLMSNSVVGCVLMRREAFEEVGGYDETMLAGNEDWELWVRLQEAGWGQVKLEEPLFRYRKHGVSMSVETEARFEEARIELARRHPRVYRREALARVKARHYPWVTVLAGPNADIARLARQTIVDAEVIVFGPDPPSTEALADRPWRVSMAEDLADAVAKSRGKFLIDWAAVIDAGPGAVEGLAEALEAEPGATAAAVEGVPRRILWRRWTVVDPDSGHVGRAEADVALRSVPCRLGEGLFPQAGWHEPDLSGAVLRQPPEIEGELPEWLETVE